MNYKDTINLPKTNFPMKANLKDKEVEILEYWEKIDIYQKIQDSRKNNPLYVFHDGPPYANESSHMGTAFNRILKDFVVKYKTMAGYKVPFIPGWDCHGMPIEHKVIKETQNDKSKYKTDEDVKQGEMLDRQKLRAECRKFAQKYVGIQMKEFKRMGEFGAWNSPYITMSSKYVCKVIEVFKNLFEKGYIYRNKKPVHWCSECKTALAEAELEYKDVKSPSIYVKLKIADYKKGNLYILIWTTTPWTLPANVAVAIHPDFKYDFVRIDNEILILCSDLTKEVMEKVGASNYKIEKSLLGKELVKEINSYEHPLFDRKGKIVLSEEFVSKDTGTGCVHIAPGHGDEDYQIGLKNDLEIMSPVDESGCFTDEAGEFAKINVFAANPLIIKKLGNLLFHHEEIEHSYPHCWRCGTPLIFRATYQWFLNLEHNNLRTKSIKELEKIHFIPEWSKDRLKNSIRSRPDWCLSRQRSWGTPIPVLYCKKCGTPVMSSEVIEKAKNLIEERGPDAWFEGAELRVIDAKELYTGVCDKCGSNEFIKEKDIFDVWFDSSSSYFAVLKENNLFPSDLYLEAVDQHRGWFQHSLLLSMITEGMSCFKTLISHGLILDKDKRKMSKSLGNIISQMEIVNEYGADVLRLYLSQFDYTCDISFDMDAVKDAILVYRKIRNTFRFMLGNIYDFKTPLNYDKLIELDKLMLHRLTILIKKVLSAYEKFEFYKVYHLIYNYCVVDLSQFYFDIIKDRLYTYGKNSIDRRSCQTVLYWTLDALVKLLAPIIPFTCEEVWQNFSSGMSVHTELMPEPKKEWLNEELSEKYEILEKVRADVLLALEKARQEKIIGNSLEAELIIWTEDKKLLDLLNSCVNFLPSFFIVSNVKIKDEGSMFNVVKIKVKRAEGKKCERCWIYSTSVGKDKLHPTICSKCSNIIKEGDYG